MRLNTTELDLCNHVTGLCKPVRSRAYTQGLQPLWYVSHLHLPLIGFHMDHPSPSERHRQKNRHSLLQWMVSHIWSPSINPEWSRQNMDIPLLDSFDEETCYRFPYVLSFPSTGRREKWVKSCAPLRPNAKAVGLKRSQRPNLQSTHPWMLPQASAPWN
jgi:hypothetical protein